MAAKPKPKATHEGTSTTEASELICEMSDASLSEFSTLTVQLDNCIAHMATLAAIAISKDEAEAPSVSVILAVLNGIRHIPSRLWCLANPDPVDLRQAKGASQTDSGFR